MMGEFKFREEDVIEIRKAHRYPRRNQFTLEFIDIDDGKPVGDWNWNEIFVPRKTRATIPVMLGPDVARMYKIKEVFWKKAAEEPGSEVRFIDPKTDTLWLIRDYNNGTAEERISFGITLENLNDDKEVIELDPLIVNE